ncbi:MAG TPA: SRPBCC domain-containing protein [Gemmatimonadota bacterium]|nr:SRPBCC domain-containing protein [Gemmatimonadota bacterium]
MSETVRLEVEIAARPETVFGFFTDPAAFGSWMGAAMGRAEIDPREGGAVTVDFSPAGPVVRGEVTAVEAPRRFAFTWGYDGSDELPPGSSTVTFDLEPTDHGTRVTLEHGGLPTAGLRDGHRGGHRVYLSLLAAGAARAEHGARLPGLARAWFEAWNADEPEARQAAIAECLADDGEFRHAWAAVRGRADLSGHIAGSRSVMGGIRLEPAGKPEQCHGWMRFGWKAVKDGATVSTGENVAVLDGSGRLRLVIGFTDPGSRFAPEV